jgi:hypothetical protein
MRPNPAPTSTPYLAQPNPYETSAFAARTAHEGRRTRGTTSGMDHSKMDHSKMDHSKINHGAARSPSTPRPRPRRRPCRRRRDDDAMDPGYPGATLLACASVKPTEARRDVGELVEQRVGVPEAVPEKQDAESRARVRARVDELMAQPLTVERALQVAMLNNRELRATLEDLGVAQADLVQAGLLQNPVISGDLVNSTRGNGLGGGLGLSQSLLSVFLIPAKRNHGQDPPGPRGGDGRPGGAGARA